MDAIVIDAKKGKVADALSDPLGSNIFDLCIAFSVPLAIYTFLNEEIILTDNMFVFHELQNFMLLMIVITILVLTSILFVKKFNKGHVIFFFSLFIGFIFFIFNQPILHSIINFF